MTLITIAERSRRCEEYAAALAEGYRLDEDGHAHRIEQRREEGRVFGEDREVV